MTTYHTSDGYNCKTQTAMIGHVLKQIRKGNKVHFIFIEGCPTITNHAARARALANAFHEKRISATLHGRFNVIVDPQIPLREALELMQLDMQHLQEEGNSYYEPYLHMKLQHYRRYKDTSVTT
jgi:hypothetical protein